MMLLTIAQTLLATFAGTVLHSQSGADAAAAEREQVIANVDGHFRDREERGFHGVVLIVEKGNALLSLLAMIVEDVSGLPYEEYIHEALIKPAGSPRIGYIVPHWPRAALAVGIRGDRRLGTPLEHAWFGDGPSWHLRGNGGMLASARDLHDLFIALESNGDVLPEAARIRWLARADRDEEGRPRLYGYLGGNGYFNAMIIRNVDADLTIVAMSNDGEHPAEDSIEALRKLYRP